MSPSWMREARHASEWGIVFGEPQIDLDQLRDWKDGVVRKMTNGLGLLRRQHHVRYQQGFGRIRDATQLNIETDGEVLPLDFDAPDHRDRLDRGDPAATAASTPSVSWTPPRRSNCPTFPIRCWLSAAAT